MDPLAYAHTMDRYNRWMNERLYALCETLSDAERRQDRGAFFGSIHGTLNHMLLGDRIWLGRFLARDFEFESLEQELFGEFPVLAQQREITDLEISRWVSSLSAERMAGALTFTSHVNPERRSLPYWFAVVHFFNHQTHHRGQLTTLMSQCGLDPGITDLIWLPAPEPAS